MPVNWNHQCAVNDLERVINKLLDDWPLSKSQDMAEYLAYGIAAAVGVVPDTEDANG
jgi:hypothetical protein